LDVTIQAQILKLLRDLQAELGMAVLMITHDLGVVANMADEVVVMYHGEVMESGAVEDIFRAPRHPYLRALLRAVPRFHMEPGERLVPIREIKQQEDTAFLNAAPAHAVEAGGDLLKVEHVSKSFAIRKAGLFGGDTGGRLLAVDDVSFVVRRGECLGLVGESGCGKTTLSKVILRALTPDGGTVTFDDGSGPLDVLALKGDAVDNIPGIQGVGGKTAVKLLAACRTIEDIAASDLAGVSIRGRDTILKRIRENLDSARTSRELARIRCDVDLGITPEQLRYRRGLPDHVLPLCSELGLDAVVGDIPMRYDQPGLFDTAG